MSNSVIAHLSHQTPIRRSEQSPDIDAVFGALPLFRRRGAALSRLPARLPPQRRASTTPSTVFASPDDEGRRVTVHLFLFDLFVPKKKA